MALPGREEADTLEVIPGVWVVMDLVLLQGLAVLRQRAAQEAAKRATARPEPGARVSTAAEVAQVILAEAVVHRVK